MSILFVILMYAGWSSMFSLGKIALDHSPPLFLTASRMLLAGFVLLGFMALKNRQAFKFSIKQFASICLLAVFSIYLTNALEFWSLQHLTAAKTCFIYSLSPFFSAIFSYLHFGEKMNTRKWLGMLIGFLGMIFGWPKNLSVLHPTAGDKNWSPVEGWSGRAEGGASAHSQTFQSC